MLSVNRCRATVCVLLLCLAVDVTAQAPPPSNQQSPEAKTTLVIERQRLRFTTRGDSIEWQLVVTNQQQEVLFDSGLVFGPALEWSLRDRDDKPVPTGLYAYTLTMKGAADEVMRTQQGNLIVDRASDSDRVWLTSNEPIGVGADGVTPQVTVSFTRPMTVGGAQMPGASSPDGAAATSVDPGVNKSTEPVVSSGLSAVMAFTNATTTDRIAKFGAGGTLTDSSILDNGGRTVSIGGNANFGALTLIGNVPNGDAPAMALYNEGGGAGASVAIDMYNTFANGGIAQAKIKAIDDGAYSDHLTFLTKIPGGPNNALAERLRVTSTGDVGIGTTTPTAKLDVNGSINVAGNINAKYQDVAEWVESSVRLAPGTVVIVDPVRANGVLPSSKAYDTRVAGAVSAQPGLLLGESREDKAMVAQSGRVRVKVDAAYGAIRIGDLLVTSPTPGYAMRSTPMKVAGQSLHRPGTLLGKALEALPSGKGEILVLLTLQ